MNHGGFTLSLPPQGKKKCCLRPVPRNHPIQPNKSKKKSKYKTLSFARPRSAPFLSFNRATPSAPQCSKRADDRHATPCRWETSPGRAQGAQSAARPQTNHHVEKKQNMGSRECANLPYFAVLVLNLALKNYLLHACWSPPICCNLKEKTKRKKKNKKTYWI